MQKLLKKLSFGINLKKSKKTTDNNAEEFSINKITPRIEYYFGKIICYSIDNCSIQKCCTLHLGNRVKILDIEKEYFPKKDFDENTKKMFITDEIISFYRKHKKGSPKITLAVPGENITFRTLVMPDLSHEDLKSAIVYEVDKQIPFPVEDCIYDYRKVYRITSEKSTRHKLTLHAILKKQITKYIDCFEDLNLHIDKIYHSQDVIGQLLKYLPDYSESTNYTLLNIGFESTEISFYKGSTLEFSHSSQVSSSMLSNSNDNSKFEYFAESIVNEIQNSLDYYAGQIATEYSNNIFVFGDFSYSSDLLNLINKKGGTKLRVFPAECFDYLSNDQKETIEIYPSCLNVLAGAVNRARVADLLPPRDKKKRQFSKINSYLKLAAAVLVLFTILSWHYFNNHLTIHKTHLLELTKQIDYFKNSSIYHTYNLVRKEIAFNSAYLNRTKETNSYLHLNLKELSNITPPGIKLLHFNYEPLENNHLFMQGIVKSDDIPPEVILAEYVENLKASPFYDNVEVVRHIKQETKDGFQIEFHLKLEGII